MRTTRTIRLGALGLAAAAACTVAVAGPANAVDPGRGTSVIALNTGQEVTDARGGAHGLFLYTIDGDELCYTLEVSGLTEPAVAAHIHLAPRGTAGDVVVPLTVEPSTDFVTEACVTDSDVPAIADDPAAYYVNVHTSTYPGGEIRGQLH
ncbi:hypothetical protein BCL57_002621 [Agromyces flavus]|uniref:CHRD domain-containing protein n=1 Tax=Agromyces flavus TaxID=589382 RepID=A0A1H1TCS2_9MICO|nr:CHRD domain-containing protein [Agromyces flavus]MCP2368448.1 hypothetical protein [Agromyces flavus]GGI47908.1 hypothetical protein GCM10010932_25960 [Agromyces flavus]SDS58115.1 CHRD domain-containing protein [Agromyces flavus]